MLRITYQNLCKQNVYIDYIVLCQVFGTQREGTEPKRKENNKNCFPIDE